MNRNGPIDSLMCLNVWPIESHSIRRCGLVRVGVALLEKVCHCGSALLRFPMFKLCPEWHTVSFCCLRIKM